MASLHLRSAAAGLEDVAEPPGGSAPLRFVVDSGLRGVVEASVDGVAVSMLVHANAGFLAMLTHDGLYRVNGRRVSKEREFGLAHDLRLSDAGRGHTEVSTLEVAGMTLKAQRIEVFDLPTTNWVGMLGVEWLAVSGAVVDFGRERLFVPDRSGERRRPADSPIGLHEGAVKGGAAEGGTVRDGVTVPLDRDPRTGRFCCALTTSTGSPPGHVGRFVVSTVAETTLDLAYARAVGMDLGAPVDEEHGPGGAVVPVFRPSDPVTLHATDGEPVVTVRPTVYDVYGYSQEPRPDGPALVAGYVGADVLQAHRGVVDFAPSAGEPAPA